MPKNPFETFGLSPELVGSLTEKDLFTVLKSMYRALAKTVHPDVAKGRRKGASNGDHAVELNLAFEALNLDKDPVAFRRHRKSFMARRPRTAYQRSLVLQREVVMGENRFKTLAAAYFDRLVADHGWPADNDEPPLVANFPLCNVRLGLLDVAINQNLKMASWSLGSNYKEINFDAEGQMTIRPVGRSDFSRAAYLRLLGSVPADQVDLMPLLDRPPSRFFKSPALNASIGADGPGFSVLNKLSREHFQNHVLVHLKPQISERSYLFSLNRPEFEKSGSVSLEGLVVKIEKFAELLPVAANSSD